MTASHGGSDVPDHGPDAPGIGGDPTAPTPQTNDLLAERDALRSTVAQVQHTRARATYIGIVIGVIVAIVLLIFILQNTESAPINFLAWTGHLPLGVAILIAAIAGALIVAMAGGLRMRQLSRALKKART